MESIRDLIRRAYEEKRVLRVTYCSKSKKESITRDIHVYSHGDWYVDAHCQLRDDYRHFRIDRIQEAELLDEPFVPDRYFSEMARRHGWQEMSPSKVTLEMEVADANELREEQPGKMTKSVSVQPEPYRPAPASSYSPSWPEAFNRTTTPMSYEWTKQDDGKSTPPRRKKWIVVLDWCLDLAFHWTILWVIVFWAPLFTCDYCGGLETLSVSDLRGCIPDEYIKRTRTWECTRCAAEGRIPIAVRLLGGKPRGNLTENHEPILDSLVKCVFERRKLKSESTK